MNKFSMAGVDFLSAETAQRDQIPSTPDDDLRGFSCGFSSGKYALFVPFFNGLFTGKVARLVGRIDSLGGTMGNLQELDTMVDRANRNVFTAFRGGFVSLWQGAIIP